MKKYYFLIIVALILGLVLTGCSLLSNVGQVPTTEQSGIINLTKAGTEADPDVFTLYAGQHINVGTVEVWDDTVNLYVKYVVNDPWRLTETHLHVAASLEDIPQTKGGNPIPGQFEYKGEHDYETEVLYEILLTWDWDPCGLYIAAHAVVAKPIEGCWETIWGIGEVEEPICEGDLSNYADEFNWGFPADPCTMGPSLKVKEPLFTDPFIVGKTPDNEFPYNSNYDRGYATEFDVQWNGNLPFGGKLTISWSPGQSDNEKKVISGDGITATSTAEGVYTPGEGWFMDKYPLVEYSLPVDPLPDGEHTINFKHTKGDGTFWDWIKLKKPCEQEETAWAVNGEGSDFIGSLPFSGKNWATYFNYRIPGVLWQIGTSHGPPDPIAGSNEYPASGLFDDYCEYTVGLDADPIGTPAMPGYIGPANVCVISPRPTCTDTTERLNIQFVLNCNFAAGELTLIYDRYGSENDILQFDGTYLATVSATEGNFGHFTLSLPQADAGPHTITIIYDGGGSGNGHYIDYLQLVNY